MHLIVLVDVGGWIIICLYHIKQIDVSIFIATAIIMIIIIIMIVMIIMIIDVAIELTTRLINSEYFPNRRLRFLYLFLI
jgi:hypothetical protein